MDNPPEFSPSEPLNHETAPSGLEWGAMALGFVVGFIGFVSYQAIMIFIINYLGSNSAGISLFSKPWFTWGWLAISLVLWFASGLIVGFVVSYRAHHHHYKFSVIVILLLFIGTLVYNLFRFWSVFGFSAFFSLINILMMIGSLIFKIAGALNGAYLAQSVKRNRGVRIQ